MHDLISIIGSLTVIITTIISSLGIVSKINKRLDDNEIIMLKNFLVRTLDEIDNGDKINEVVKLRLYESYDKYCGHYKQNSYVKDTWERLKKDGKL